ncbi:uncharacterized protein BDZ99DRAFT_8228 [Mytilinidion resinicola]|uniref:Uncharacterized protein n=1 Tax=Mytilinidion resinicola TaxID=574789 RepID=A0A6A6Z8K7_9PEZI|nr:uncharacterized protein BDZ99DRAFT_8228 [Mytilinidion resinicola]KAF2817063.1 hypothetical protein BDZ99DRAFT_8228 [Mytilinidion resinicola]
MPEATVSAAAGPADNLSTLRRTHTQGVATAKSLACQLGVYTTAGGHAAQQRGVLGSPPVPIICSRPPARISHVVLRRQIASASALAVSVSGQAWDADGGRRLALLVAQPGIFRSPESLAPPAPRFKDQARVDCNLASAGMDPVARRAEWGGCFV